MLEVLVMREVEIKTTVRGHYIYKRTAVRAKSRNMYKGPMDKAMGGGIMGEGGERAGESNGKNGDNCNGTTIKDFFNHIMCW